MTTKTKKQRSPGRPKEDLQRDARQALIDATRKLLLYLPPSKLAIATIAQEANVAPSLVRYYFGSKEGLISAAAASWIEELQTLGNEALEGKGTLTERVAGRMAPLIAQTQNEPIFTQIVMERLYASPAKEVDPLAAQAVARGLRLTLSLLHGDPGEPLRSVDPRFVHLMLIGLCSFFGSSGPMVRQLFGADADMPALTKQYIAFVTDVLLNGLRSGPADDTQTFIVPKANKKGV